MIVQVALPISGVELDTTVPAVTIQRGVGALFPGPLLDDHIYNGVFGLKADGTAYFDPGGAVQAERATLRYDADSGYLVLEPLWADGQQLIMIPRRRDLENDDA